MKYLSTIIYTVLGRPIGPLSGKHIQKRAGGNIFQSHDGVNPYTTIILTGCLARRPKTKPSSFLSPGSGPVRYVLASRLRSEPEVGTGTLQDGNDVHDSTPYSAVLNACTS